MHDAHDDLLTIRRHLRDLETPMEKKEKTDRRLPLLEMVSPIGTRRDWAGNNKRSNSSSVMRSNSSSDLMTVRSSFKTCFLYPHSYRIDRSMRIGEAVANYITQDEEQRAEGRTNACP